MKKKKVQVKEKVEKPLPSDDVNSTVVNGEIKIEDSTETVKVG